MVLTSIGIIDDQRVLGNPVVNCYTSGTSTWCKCPGAQVIGIVVIGGGGGGGDSINICTVGCSTLNIAGGGGGGGGGISSCCLSSANVPDTATVVVGNGGLRGSPSTAGGHSCFVGSGLTVCAGGACRGQQNTSTSPSPYISNGGAGGSGTAVNGNSGGSSCGGPFNGFNAGNSSGRTRAGGGGGGSRYCNIIPTSCTSCTQGTDSSSFLYDPNWMCGCGAICTTTVGKGGRGGNSSLNFCQNVCGENGNAGLVYIVQYF
jgi:hypothetical protein